MIHHSIWEQLTNGIGESRKALVSLLSKLTLPDAENDSIEATTQNWKLKSLMSLVAAIRSKRPFSDASSRNALNKFDSALLKRWPDELEGFDEDAFRGEAEAEGGQEVQELFGFIDDVCVS